MDEPMCGKCGLVMTPANSRIHPEYFLHDACLPDELRPAPVSPHKDYLGDGVYADVEKGMLKLTTEDGIRVTNTIYLEPEVYVALRRYAGRVLDK